jgi:hypothetical protein
MVMLASADDLRSYLGITSIDLADARADLLLAGVSGLVLDYCNRPSFDVVTDEVVRLNGSGIPILLLPSFPVQGVTSVVENPDSLSGGTPHDLITPTNYIDWSDDGVIERVDGAMFLRRRRWYEVTYSHGYAGVPDSVKLLVLKVSARAVVNPEQLATEAIGTYTVGYAPDETRLPSLSDADRRDLAPYRLP